MAKFHINNKGEAKPCRAKVRCRFGGTSGNENHYDSKEAAEKVIQEKYAKKFRNQSITLRKTDNEESRIALEKLSNKGIKINSIESIYKHDFSNKINNPTVSSIDIIDEGKENELMRLISEGKAKVF